MVKMKTVRESEYTKKYDSATAVPNVCAEAVAADGCKAAVRVARCLASASTDVREA